MNNFKARRVGLFLLLAILLTLSFIGCKAKTSDTEKKDSSQPTSVPDVQETNLVLATNPVGTGYYIVAAAQGSLLTQKTNINVVVQPTSGPEGVIETLKSGQSQLVLMEPFLVRTFWKDEQDVKRVRTLQAGNILRFAFVTHEGTNIKTVSDLKGKRVTFTGLSASHTMIAQGILKAYGLDPEKDVKPLKMSFATAGLTDLAEGRTDAVIASIAGGKMEELASKIKTVVIPVEEDKAKESAQWAPMLLPSKLTIDVKGGPKGTPVVGMITALYTTKDLDEQAAYTITKALVENYKEIIPISEECAEWVPDAAVTPSAGFPYHPGAIKYYKEVGLWNDSMEKWQQEQLK